MPNLRISQPETKLTPPVHTLIITLETDAKLSGIPDVIINRAKAVLKQLESEKTEIVMRPVEEAPQLPIETTGALEIMKELKFIDVNTLTPIECMTVLHSLADKAKKM